MDESTVNEPALRGGFSRSRSARARSGCAGRNSKNLLDRQQRVNEAAAIVVDSMAAGEDSAPMLSAIGRALLREDRNFHSIQAVEAAFRQHALAHDSAHARDTMVAAVRYLAAHAPTARAQAQTFRIAQRLHRGDRLHEEGASA